MHSVRRYDVLRRARSLKLQKVHYRKFISSTAGKWTCNGYIHLLVATRRQFSLVYNLHVALAYVSIYCEAA